MHFIHRSHVSKPPVRAASRDKEVAENDKDHHANQKREAVDYRTISTAQDGPRRKGVQNESLITLRLLASCSSSARYVPARIHGTGIHNNISSSLLLNLANKDSAILRFTCRVRYFCIWSRFKWVCDFLTVIWSARVHLEYLVFNSWPLWAD